MEEDQVGADLDEVKCAMICEALKFPDLRRPGGTLVCHNGQLLMRQVFNLRPVDQQILRCPGKDAVRAMLKVQNVASSCRIYIQPSPDLQNKVF
jgi:hypothetical protein